MINLYAETEEGARRLVASIFGLATGMGVQGCLWKTLVASPRIAGSAPLMPGMPGYREIGWEVSSPAGAFVYSESGEPVSLGVGFTVFVGKREKSA